MVVADTRPLPDYRLDEIELDPTNKTIPVAGIGEVLTDGTLTLSMVEVSTLEFVVDDERKALLRGDFLTGWTWGADPGRDEARWIKDGRKIDLRLDDLRFRLKRLQKAEDRALTLECREWAAERLRQFRGARQMTRAQDGQPGGTRAMFVRLLADEAGVPWHIPELSDPQTIRHAPELTQQAQKRHRNTHAQKGVPATGITVKGAKASPEQLQNIQAALDECAALNAPERACLAALVAGTAEGGWLTSSKNPRSTALGPYQILSSTATAIGVSQKDVKGATKRFLQHGFGGDQRGAIKISRQDPHASPGEIADKCEAGGAGAGFYDHWLPEAKRTLKAYGGASTKGGGIGVVVEQAYSFARGKKENSWDCIQRLAEEVGWYAFVRKGVLWFASRETLMVQEPALVAFEAEEGEPPNGIISIVIGGIDLGARDVTADITITADVGRTAVLPGMAVDVQREGPADGRWIVKEIGRPLWDQTATIQCFKPTGKKDEPAAETKTVTFGGTTPASGEKLHGADIRTMAPKKVIDKYVLPIARKHGINVTPSSVEQANARHGPTVSGGRSDHQGPPSYAWAADMSNGSHPTPQMDALARDLGDLFGIKVSFGSAPLSGQIWEGNIAGFRVQIIYRTMSGGDHTNHVHCGLRKTSSIPVIPLL